MKKHLMLFASHISLTTIFNEMFIFNDKPPCCNNTVINVQVNKEYLANRPIMFDS